jgi:dihydropteroate synthase
LEIESQGADILDIGGESTRPFSAPVSSEEQIERIVPVLKQLRGRLTIPISVDTQSSEVAAAAIELGAEIVNDVSGLTVDPLMTKMVADLGVAVCIMHMQGTPATMQVSPVYEDVVAEIRDYLYERYQACLSAGIHPERICLDPGIGFGKTHQHNLEILRNVNEFLTLPTPILIGHSRKGFIAHVLGDKSVDRAAGSIGVSLAMACAGVHIIRVHDVRETVHALKLFREVMGKSISPPVPHQISCGSLREPT